jgi:hypothetical protein
MSTWYEDNPGLLEEEHAALERAGIPFTVDEGWRAAGVLRLELAMTVDGETLDLVAIYPDVFPFTKPEVYAHDLDLPRHQHQGQKNLCLLGRSSDLWETDRTLAQHLTEQLPKLLLAARRPEGTPSPVPEEPQGEPASDYYPAAPGAAVLIDSAMTVPAGADRGQLMLRVDKRPIRVVTRDAKRGIDAPIVRSVLTQIRADGVTIAAPDALINSIGDGADLTARWVRLDPPPPAPSFNGDLSEFQRDLFTRCPWLADHRTAPAYNGKHHLDVIGIVFREELAQDRYGDGWLFVVRAFRGRATDGVTYLARAMRAGPGDLLERIPSLAGMPSKKVALVGLGGVGAPIALELAKAQLGELRLLDHDRVDAGTAVRWPFGLESSGRDKVQVIEEHIAKNLPYTKVSGAIRRLGGVRLDPAAPSDQQVLDDLLAGVDLLIDASAEYLIHYLLSREAAKRGLPYLEVATRNGAWGGIMARIPRDGCWLCYESLVEDLRIRDPSVAPAADPAPFRQPLGCADPTFTGTGFDIGEYALIATRLAIGTLLADAGYASPPWDVAIVDLHTDDGRPRWSTFPLERHPRCPIHRAA